MTTIKCRYKIPHCRYMGRNTRVYHNDYFWCDESGYCEVDGYTKPATAKEFNPQCIHCSYISGEFEKTVKRYEYCEGVGLKIGGEIYTDPDIDYLEIDGRVLVDNTEGENAQKD